MTYVKEILKVCVLWLLCMILAPIATQTWRNAPEVAQHVTATAKNVDTASQGLPQLIGSLNQMGVRGQYAMDSVQTGADKLSDVLDNVRDVSGQMVDTAGSAMRLIDHATVRVDSLAETQARADVAIDAVSTIPSHINPVLDGLPPLEKSLTHVSTVLGTYVGTSLTGATDGLSVMEQKSALIVQHTDAWLYPPKYNGKHKFLHGAWKGTEAVLKLTPGIAGGVALAKGN